MAHPTTMNLLRRNLAYRGLRLSCRSGNVAGALLSPRRVAVPCVQVAVNQNAMMLTSFHTNSRTFSARHNNEAIVTHDEVEGEGPWIKDIKKRGLYHEHRYAHYHQYKIDTVGLSQDKKKMTVNWTDGHTSVFDAIWLRHQCHCGDCKHDTNGMVKIEWQSLPMDITILSAQPEGDRMVVFEWGTPDGTVYHQGAIPTATLRCYCYSDTAIKDRRERRAMRFHEDKTIPQIECEEYFASDAGLHKCLSAVNDRGVCLVKNVPTNFESWKETMTRIGPIQSTMYGEFFDVVATPNPINAAYSSAKLGLHMDLPFYETPPGLQILHCLRFNKDTVGGNNILLDIHEIAHKFRKEQPEFFDRLTKLPTLYQSIHYNRPVPVHMETQRPIFSLNNYGELVSVTWHPKIPGPPELPQEDVVPYYEAYTAFYKMISESEALYKFRFEEGDFMIFNNRRILHGREAFTDTRPGGRHLLGGYIELSDFHSRLQALHNEYDNGRFASRSGSLSWL